MKTIALTNKITSWYSLSGKTPDCDFGIAVSITVARKIPMRDNENNNPK